MYIWTYVWGASLHSPTTVSTTVRSAASSVASGLDSISPYGAWILEANRKDKILAAQLKEGRDNAKDAGDKAKDA